jgi:hypothetical protein
MVPARWTRSSPAADGLLTVHMEHTVRLEDVAKAHELSEAGRVRGKIGVAVT